MLNPKQESSSPTSNLIKAAILDELGRSTEVKNKKNIELNTSNLKDVNEEEQK